MSRLDPQTALQTRLAAYAWPQITDSLNELGHAVMPGLLTSTQCSELIALYPQAELFRKRIVMGQHGYGRGEYQYFANPLPDLVQTLREQLYTHMAQVANHWSERLSEPQRFPLQLAELTRVCAELGQLRPTPLMLKYAEGDYNRLHQDIYGELVFPLQVVTLLNVPGVDFDGGEFVLTEQRARMQSRVEVVPLNVGDAVVFPVAQRPIPGKRGDLRVKMRHGVSRIRSGSRYTLGIIFHDAT